MDRQPFPIENELKCSVVGDNTGKQNVAMEKNKGVCPGGRVLKRRRECNHDLCPRCFNKNEICIHVLQCLVNLERTQRKKAIEELEDTLVTLQTNLSIITVWKSKLLGWKDQTRVHSANSV